MIEREPTKAPGPALQSLLALHELQATLSNEIREDAILRLGVRAVVEMLGSECGVALIEAVPPRGPQRSGWGEGRTLADHEIEILERSLEAALQELRRERAPRVILALERRPGEAAPMAETPATVRSRGFGSVLALALRSGGRRLGALVLARYEPYSFDQEQLLLSEALADQIAVQLERVRRAEEAALAVSRHRQDVEAAAGRAQERSEELEALDAVATAVGPSIDPGKAMENALRRTLEVTRQTAGAIYLVESGPEAEGSDAPAGAKEALVFARGAGSEDYVARARSARWRRDEGAPGRTWTSGEPVAVFTPPDGPAGPESERLQEGGYRRALYQPLRARGRVIGVLELVGAGEGLYREGDLRIARVAAGQAALAIENSRLLSEITRHSLELEVRCAELQRDIERCQRTLKSALEVAEAAAEPGSPGETIARALARSAELLGADAAAVHIFNAGTQMLRLETQRGFSAETQEEIASLQPDDAFLGRAFRNDDLALLSPEGSDLVEGPGWSRRTSFRTWAAIGLRSPNGPRGTVMFAWQQERALPEHDRPAAAALAVLIGAAAREVLPAPRPAEAAASGPASAPEPRQAQLVQAQKSESIGTLAGGIAHDYNNILGAIMGYAGHIKTLAPSDSPIQSTATVIEEQSKRAAELTRQLVSFARGGEGTREPVDVNRLISETVSFASRSLDPSFSIETRLAPGLPAVDADAGQLRQVLLNAAVNARDAMPQGGTITFETRLGHLDEHFVNSVPDLAPGDYVAIIVSDSGAGMTPDVLERAFEPFFTTKGEGGGTGLGLAASREIVRGHHGHIAISSAPGTGTALRIYLPSAGRPAPALPEPVETPAPAPVPSGSAAPTGVRVLVVDDEQVIRDMAKDILQARGHDVVLAKDGVEALEIYRREWGRIHLVLLDLAMPRLGGLETFRRLSGMDRESKVVLCSGYGHDEQAKQAIKEGALGLLPKPYGRNELLAWVDKVRRRDAA